MLRFPLIVLVVYLHNGSGTVRFANAGIVERSSSPMLDYFVAFLSDGVARVAVPLFFLMAGYLFFNRAIRPTSLVASRGADTFERVVEHRRQAFQRVSG